MAELSPAAQAVWEAFNEDEAGVFVDYGEKLAAALRAAADQVPVVQWEGRIDPDVVLSADLDIGIAWACDALYALANQLEAQ